MTQSASNEFLTEREAVCETCRLLADKGYLAGTGGNVALRAGDFNFCVTPSGTDYYTMSAEDVCVLRLEDGEQISGAKKPSVESGLHALVLKGRPDCVASIHTHQPIASAFTLLATPLKVISETHRRILGDVVPCAGYAPSGTSWLAGKVARKVQPNVHAYLMRNHGVVCVGESLEAAIQRVTVLEQACAEFFNQQLALNSSVPEGVADAIRSKLTAV